MNAFRLIGQLVVCAAFAAVIGYFSYWPLYLDSPPGMAQIKISFAHVGAPKGACRKLSKADQAHLAPNMRRLTVCPRERVPVRVEIDMDGQTVLARSLPPSGFRNDGAAIVYETFTVEPGPRTITMRLRDTARETGFDYATEQSVSLAPGRSLAIDFKADEGGFVLY